MANAFLLVCILAALGDLSAFVTAQPTKMCSSDKPCVAAQGVIEPGSIKKIFCVDNLEKCLIKIIKTQNGNTFVCQAIDSQEYECKFLTSSAHGHATVESFEESGSSGSGGNSANADGVFEKRSLPFETLNYGKRAKSVVYFVGKRSE